MRINLPVVNVHKKKSKKSEVITQLLYGDTFKKLKKDGKWIKIKNDLDNYKGYIINKNFPVKHKNTHKIYNLSSTLYSRPNEKYKIKKKLSFGTKIKVLKKKKIFYKFDSLWIKKKDVKKIKFITKDSFKNVKKFVNVK